MTSSPRRAKPEIKSNTAYRGIGAIIVMFYHFSAYKLNSGEVLRLIPFGKNIGVTLDLFFILSGFVIAYIYANLFAAGMKRDDLKTFFWHRFVRLYPLHLFALLVFLAERAAYVLLASHKVTVFSGADPTSFFYAIDGGVANTPYTLLANVFIMHGVGFTSALSWNYPSWTVSSEYAAYLVFPLMCLLISRTGRYAIPLLIGLALGAYLLIEIYCGTVDIVGYIGAIRTVPGFALGVAMCLLARRLESVPTAYLQVLQTIVLAGTLLGLIYGEFQTPLVCALALLALITAPNRGWLSGALAWEPLQFLGRISYAVYMMHVVTGIAVKEVMNIARPAVGIADAQVWWPYAVLAAQLGATIVVATIAFRFVELPARTLLSGLVKRRRATPAAATAPANEFEPRRGAVGRPVDHGSRLVLIPGERGAHRLRQHRHVAVIRVARSRARSACRAPGTFRSGPR